MLLRISPTLVPFLSAGLSHVIRDRSLKAHLSPTLNKEPQLRTSGVTLDPLRHARTLWPNKEVVYCLNDTDGINKDDLAIIREGIEKA